MIPENKVIEGFRLAPQQARLWNIPLSIEAYRAQGAWLLSGVIDTSHLQQALREVVKRHEILRTVFATLPGVKYPIQVIVEDASFVYREVSIDDVQNRNEVVHAASIEHILQEEVQFTFDYQQGPHLRVCLLTLSLHRYALIITLPALCADGRTLHCLISEIGHLYTIIGKAKNSDAKEPVQYVQFSEWQNELLTEWQNELLADKALDNEDGRAYWRNQQYREIQSLYLPEQNRANQLTGTVDTIQLIQIESDVLARLESLAEALSVTLDMLLLAGWYALLWRLVGQRRISLGYLCDGRKYEELTDALGLFAKWVPITCEIADDYSFNELLHETKRIIREAQQWQEYFVWEETLNNETEMTQSLFSFGFSYEMRAEPHWGEELDAKLFRQQINTDYFHLYLVCVLTNNSLCIEFNYNKRSFTTEAVTRLASQYVNILHQVNYVGNGVAIAELDLLNPTQRKQILYDWNQTASFFPYEKCVHQLIEEHAASSPATTALVTGFECLTYEELNRRANMLAHYLITLGAGPEKRVGILLNRSIEMFVALLGVLKAGAAYVPLEADQGVHRLRYMLMDAKLSVLLTQESLVRSLPESEGLPIICLDKDWIQISAYPDRNPICGVQPDNLIYVIYTSGSTGLPKGTLITHRGVVNYLHWSAKRYTDGFPINALVHSPIAFDLTVTSVFVPWLVGGCVSIVEGGDSGSDLINGLRQHGTMNDLLKVTPSHLEVLYQETLPAKITEIGQVLIVGGEALFSEMVKPWRERYPELRIINEYGPTETVVGCCVYEIPPTFESFGAVPIGRPIINSKIYILDEKYRPAPIGVVGEIYIGGMGMARGYHHRSELTARKFIPHPYGTQPGERLYKTGDLGRYLSDGNLEYIGRMDEQVKVRGYRIEPGEIEAILLGHDRVREAIVIVRPDEPDATYAGIHNSNRLIAYIVGDKNLKSSDWQPYLRDRLPGYMIPSTFVMLDQMPLARNGKVDRQALPDPGYTQTMTGKTHAAPRSFTEEVLVSIWSEVLRIEPISIHDNFFDLGGDSMRSIQVCARAQRRGLKLTHDQIFQYRTISQLALKVHFDETGKALQTVSRMFNLISEEDRKQLPADVEDAYPLAMLQAGMIFHSEFNPDAAIFHDQHSFHIHARFDPITMERTVREIMERQSVLRTSFELSLFTQPLQLVHKFVPIPLTIDDLRHSPIESHDSTIGSWMNADKKRHFVWNQAPLIRFHVHRRSDESFQFTMSFHHAILDGWSAATLLTELFKHYLELLVDPELPGEEPLAVSYRDFVAMEQEILASEEGKQYWSKQLEDVTIHRLPRLQEPKPSGVIPVEVSNVIIPMEVSNGLKIMARTSSIPIKSVLLAAHMKVMSLFSGSMDVVSGLVFNGRPEEMDGDRVLGLFLNTLPFRILLSGGSWRNLIEHVFEVERDSLPFRRYPLAEIQRIIGGQPLFETSFNFMHYHIYNSVGELKDVQLLGYSGYEETNFTLTANFSLEVVSGNVHLVLNYHPTELTSQQIEVIGGYYLSVLTAMVTDPHSRYALYNPLSTNEIQQLLIDWNQTAKEFGTTDLIHELFESQAKRTPDHIAVIYDSAQLTYYQLNALADGLASRLQRLGVKPEVRVAILVDRSIELVIGLLGILKAGGAYVPLDPSYPQERLRMMVEDSEASVMLVGSQYRELVTEYSGEVIELRGGTTDWCESGGEKSIYTNGTGKVEEGNVAYVIYTSGSTGRPKGVMNTHGAIRNRLLWMQETYKLKNSDCVLQKTPYSFDVSVWEFFWPLMYGAQLILAQPGGHQDSQYIVEVIREKKISVLHFVPPMLSIFIEEDVFECNSVRQIISSGEALSGSLARRVHERMDWVNIDNLYGPTEAAIDVTRWRCFEGEETVPIGRPIANIELYILNESGGVVPIGVEGELHIGGVGLARGYDNRTDLTAEKFAPHPFSSIPGARLYCTGDLSRYLVDGQIEYLGRLDQQVKIRGNRIELGDIQATLLQHNGVHEVVLMAQKIGIGKDLRLVAYFIPENKIDVVTQGELREFLRGRLPEFMVPSYFVPIDKIPLAPNGKVNRRALLLMEEERKDGLSDYVAPQSIIEKTIADIWANLLGTVRIGVSANFFELGGHSLIATQVITRLRDIFHINIPLRAIFEAPTVWTLAKFIEQQQEQSTTADPAVSQLNITSQGTTDIDKMLEDLESLSSDEVKALLGEDQR